MESRDGSGDLRGYFWPSPEAVTQLNKLMNLPATGREQDWEVELADPDRLGEFIDLLRSGVLDFEAQSALALLITCTAMYSRDDPPPQTLATINQALECQPQVLERMRSYWGRLWAKDVQPREQAMLERTKQLIGDFRRFDPYDQ